MAGARPRAQDRCLLMWPAILSMSMLETGKIALSVESGRIMRPCEREFFLMYSQTFFVTSVRGNVFAPQIAANAGLRVFGAKMPFPAFFIAAAFFFPVAFWAALPIFLFSAVIFFKGPS